MTNTKKVAIVTGGASGIGFAIAKKFTENNIITYIIGRNKEKLADASNALGENSRIISFDMNELSKIPDLIRQIQSKEGRIDILVNNAGINQKKPLAEVTDEDFQKVILTN